MIQLKKAFTIATILACLALIGCGSSSNPSSDSTEQTNNSPVVTLPEAKGIVGTGQTLCYNAQSIISCPSSGADFYGQDAQIEGLAPSYTDNGDGTVTDNNTGLMWSQSPDLDGDGDIDANDKRSYDLALAEADEFNLAGYSDWRLPNVKELQSLLDYSKSPATHGTAAIDDLFLTTEITNEAGQADFPAFWSSTTHANMGTQSGGFGAYVNFGRAMGYMGNWVDVHGAGAQRSDPKAGDASNYPEGHGPQGDAIRIDNFVRLVRDL